MSSMYINLMTPCSELPHSTLYCRFSLTSLLCMVVCANKYRFIVARISSWTIISLTFARHGRSKALKVRSGSLRRWANTSVGAVIDCDLQRMAVLRYGWWRRMLLFDPFILIRRPTLRLGKKTLSCGPPVHYNFNNMKINIKLSLTSLWCGSLDYCSSKQFCNNKNVLNERPVMAAQGVNMWFFQSVV